MIVKVLVKPGSKKGPFIDMISSDEIVVYLREKPHDGEANAALIKMLAEYYGVAKSFVAIKRGQKSHQKLVEVIK